MLPALPVRVDLRQPVGNRDTDLRIRGVQIGLGHAHIRALTYKVRRQAERQSRSKPERPQLERRRQTLSREPPGERREKVSLLSELLLKRGQQQARLCDSGLLRHHIRKRDLATVVLPPQNIEQLSLDIDQTPRNRDLAAQRGFLNRRQRDVRGERRVDGLALKLSRLGLCLRRLNRTPRSTEHIRHERDRDLRCMQTVKEAPSAAFDCNVCVGVSWRLASNEALINGNSVPRIDNALACAARTAAWAAARS